MGTSLNFQFGGSLAHRREGATLWLALFETFFVPFLKSALSPFSTEKSRLMGMSYMARRNAHSLWEALLVNSPLS